MDGCKYLTCFNLCDLFIILFQLHFVVSCHQSKISEIEKILKLDIKIPEIVYKKAEAASEPQAPVHNPLDDSKPAEEESVYHSVTPSGISRGKQLPMLSMNPTDFESMTLDDIKDEECVTSVPKYAETKAQEEHEEDDNEDEDNEDEDNDSDDSSSDSDSNDESSSSDSSDSSDSEVDQKDEPPTQEDKEDDNYWGLPDLSSDDEDNDDDCIPTFPSHLLQELENNEKRSSDAIASFQNRSGRQSTPPPTPQEATPVPKTPVIGPPIQENPEDSIQAKLDNIQERQEHLRDFMNQFQSGEITPTHCPECLERLTQGLGPSHVAHHIRDLSIELDTMYTLRRTNKDKRHNKRKVQPKIESPKKKQKSLPRKSSSESPKDEDRKPRMGKEAEFRKKMWKRIYGRKKYQLRNTGREVTVSEEEIDAEIKKDALRNSKSEAAEELLWRLVENRSAEYRSQRKRARDRLAKRILRITKDKSSTRNIQANEKIMEVESVHGSVRESLQENVQESVQKDFLDLSAELIAKVECMIGANMDDIVKAVTGDHSDNCDIF